MTAHILRPASVLLSATLMAIAAEPLPTATPLTGVQVANAGSQAAHVTTGDVDGDGFVDVAVGNTLFWGSAAGWVGSSYSDMGGVSLIAIVPNLTGPGADTIIRSDVVLVDANSGATLCHVEPIATTARVTTTSALNLGLFASMGQSLPAVGDFRGDSKLDIAWIDKDGLLTLATNQGGSFSTQSVNVGSAQYSAVAGIDWSGKNTGELDLLLVHQATTQQQTTVYEAQLFPHNTSLTNPSGFTGTIDAQGYNAIYLPQITVGNIDKANGQDFIINGRGTTQNSIVGLSTGSTSTAPSFKKITGTSAWIVPDITGDGIADVAVSKSPKFSRGGIVCGRSGLDISTASAVDRPIPINGQSVPAYQFAFNPFDSTLPQGLRPIAVSYQTADNAWQRRLLLVDISNYGGSTSQILSVMSPQLSVTALRVAGSGPQAVVDLEASIDFVSSVGAVARIEVDVFGSSPGDAFSDASAVPAGVTPTEDRSNGFKRTYAGAFTTAEALSILTNLRFSAASGGVTRTVKVSIACKADPADVGTFYQSIQLETATLSPVAAPLTLSGPTTGQVNQSFVVNVSGGSAPYSASASNGATAVVGQVTEGPNGSITPIMVTPTAAGVVTVTVTDATDATQTVSVTVVANATALNIAGPTSGLVGQPLTLRLSGGVASYSVSATGATAVLGQATSDQNGDYTPITVTPTAAGFVTVSVTDSTDATQTFSITVAANTPALNIVGPTAGLVGQPVTLRLSGGVANYSVSATGATAVLGQATSDQNGAYTPITVTPTAVGPVSVTVTDSVNGTTTFTLTASAQPVTITGPTAASVGQNITLLVSNGTPGYTVQVSGGVGLVGSATANGTNVFVTPTQPGQMTVTITDSAGVSASYVIAATALPVATQPSPVIPASVGGQTVFGAICPGSTVGVQSLRAAFSASNSSRARGFTWDGPSQTYRELPAEPTAGLQPTDGIFLASRVDLGLELSGPAMPPGTALVLSAGWNFVGIGPVQLTSGTVVRTHSLIEDFALVDLAGAAVPTTTISQAYTWDGTAYSTSFEISSGVGYFIKNVSSPAKTILLRRKNSDVDTRAVHTVGFARGVEAPPAPPSAQAQAADSSTSSSCGAGSGIVALIAGCLAFLRIRLRR